MSDAAEIDRPEPDLPARAREGRNATALATVWARLERAEELLATMGAGLSVTKTLMDEYGCTRRQARALQAAVRMRWVKESAGEGRAQRVERYRRTLEQVVKQGFDRTRTVYSADGDSTTYADPDLKAVTAATALLLRMDGADQPDAAPALPPGEEQGAAGAQVVLLTEEEAAAEMARRRREDTAR